MLELPSAPEYPDGSTELDISQAQHASKEEFETKYRDAYLAHLKCSYQIPSPYDMPDDYIKPH